jgi:hypothetical protein
MEIMKLFAHIIMMTALMDDCRAQSAKETFVTEAASLPSACSKTAGTYFDSNMLRCVACPAATEPNTDYTGCECAPGFRRVPSPAQVKRMAALSATARAAVPADYFLGDFLPTCKECTTGTAPSQDKSACLKCTDASVAYNRKGHCQCKTAGYLIQTFDALVAGKERTGAFTCGKCAEGSFRGPLEAPIYECQACQVEGMGYDANTPLSRANVQGWDCACGKGTAFKRWGGDYLPAGEKCLRKADVDVTAEQYQASVSIEYRAVQQSTTVGETKISGYSLATSDTFVRLQLSAAVGCFMVTSKLPDGAKVRDAKSCEVLANLCVL